MEWALLAGVPPEELRHTLALARRRTFGRNETVFHAGDPAETVHLIERGRAVVRTATPFGQRATLAILGPGEAFGELALLGRKAPRSASVIAIEPLVTLSIYEADFHRLRREYPQVAEVIVALLTVQVRRLSELLVDALYLPAELRIRKRLAEIAERYDEAEEETIIPLRQEDIADLAGTSRATVNRVLREEARRGSVRLTRGQTIVVDRQRLLDLLPPTAFE
jgi:CRP/FNR family transcriptional regulator, cyclic AMP receptor protein